MTIRLVEDRLVVSFQYNRPIIDALKELPDRVYNPTDHSWSIGFTELSLSVVFDFLARYFTLIDVAYLNKLEADCRVYLSTLSVEKPVEAKFDVVEVITEPLALLGTLVIEAYTTGRINQKDQGLCLDLINHLSLRDFIR